MFLGFDRLMQTLVVTATEHNATGKLVNDQHLIVLDDVIDIAVHHAVRLDRLVDVVEQGDVFGIHQVFHLKRLFRLFHT